MVVVEVYNQKRGYLCHGPVFSRWIRACRERAYDSSLGTTRRDMVYLRRGGALIIRLVAQERGSLFPIG